MRTTAFGFLLTVTTVACGPDVEPASQLSTLRILAIKKDDPYVRVEAPATTSDSGEGYQPDNVVELRLGLEDARPSDERLGEMQSLWFAGCNNPYADNYFPCLVYVWLSFRAYESIQPNLEDYPDGWGLGDVDSDSLAAFVAESFPDESQGGQAYSEEEKALLLEQVMAIRIGAGSDFSYTIPSWLIERHAPPADPDVPPYGLSQIYSVVCDGELALSEEWQGNLDPTEVLTDATRGFPLTCLLPDTLEQRGPDHFMAAYSNVYAYETLIQNNPVISGVELDGDEVDTSAVCLGVVCPLYEDACDNPRAPHIAHCTRSSAGDCETLDLYPVIDESKNSEVNEVATVAEAGGVTLLEQMWIRYYADRGEIVSESKRLQDATEGWFSDYGTEWRVPKSAGSVHLWSVVYDNRGGVEWARTSVCVE